MLGGAIQVMLTDAAHAVDWVTDGHAALEAVKAAEYDAVILDLGLPRRDGLQVLRALRGEGNDIPVVVVTARDAVEERVLGLDLGADDYLVKPFAGPELLARLRAVGRRRSGAAAPKLTNGRLTLDPATHEATMDGHQARLTPREYALLHALMRRPGTLLSRTQLEERIYGWNDEIESNAVEFLIHSVRRRLGPDSIRNVRGVGWKVDAPRDGARDA